MRDCKRAAKPNCICKTDSHCLPVTARIRTSAECGEYNAIQAADLCRSQVFSSVQVHKDLAGQLRLVEAAKV